MSIIHAYEDEGLPSPLVSNPDKLWALAAMISLYCNTPINKLPHLLSH